MRARVDKQEALRVLLLTSILVLAFGSEQKDDPDELRIQQEIAQYNDILRLDLVDTYNDLSLKTLKMFSVLPAKFDADFYFKIDDDVAVNVHAMSDYLKARRTQGNLYLVCSPICFSMFVGKSGVDLGGGQPLRQTLAILSSRLTWIYNVCS
jgi:hypothetical protein